MLMKALFDQTLERLDQHFATRTIRLKVAHPGYDRSFGEKICNLMFQLCDKDEVAYQSAVDDFIHFSLEFLQLQIELEKTGSYKLHSYQEALDTVYNNPDVMEKRYLHGMLLSQAFWINHEKIFDFFRKNFCLNNAPRGSVLEVPIGTGIYLSEFIHQNKTWSPVGCDISESAVTFAKRMIAIYNERSIDITKKNVFDLPTDQPYDRIICGELLEHLEQPTNLLLKLKRLLAGDGKIFLTTAIWAASIDHIYLFTSVHEVRKMLHAYFTIENELALPVLQDKKSTDEKTPINYACILSKSASDN